MVEENETALSEQEAPSERVVQELKMAEAHIAKAQGEELAAINDLREAEAEIGHVEQELQATRKHLVSINVDGVEHEVRGGKWVVHELKTKLGIDQAKVLAEITPEGLKDLDDDQVIEVRAGERFMTHARSGGSS